MNKNFLNNIKYFFGRSIKSINDQIKPNPKVEQNDINKQKYVEDVGYTDDNAIRTMKGRKQLFKSRDKVDDDMQPGSGKSNVNNLERDNVNK